MQRRKASPPGGDEEQLRPLELVFTCSICNESIHDIYKFSEDNQGFSDRRQSDQKVVTRLWLTECGHLTCSTHLENGCEFNLRPIERCVVDVCFASRRTVTP